MVLQYQVITPMSKGLMGTANPNAELPKMLYPSGKNLTR